MATTAAWVVKAIASKQCGGTYSKPRSWLTVYLRAPVPVAGLAAGCSEWTRDSTQATRFESEDDADFSASAAVDRDYMNHFSTGEPITIRCIRVTEV